MQLGAAKRTRTIGMCNTKKIDETDLEVDKGPSHGRPMPLNLAQGSEIVDQQGFEGGAIKGKRQGAPPSGRVPPPTYVPSYSDKSFHNLDVDDDDSVSEDDDDDDEQIVELSLKNPARFAEVMATERPTWKEPGGIDTPRSAAKLQSRQSTDSLGSSGSVGGHAPAGATPASTPMMLLTPEPRARPAELLDEGAGTPPPNRALTATPESPVPAVSRVDTDLDAIENLRASMLFHNAFPDVTIAFAFTRDALITATEKHGHGGGIVQRRLQVDGEYLTKLVSLSRVRFPLFRGEVKERCNAVSVPPIIATHGSAAEISRLIRKQLSGYNYIFPGAPGNMGITGLVKMVCCMPLSMSGSGGAQQISEFSANAYLDVYLANVNTLKHILNNRERAFHIMMSDIYAQASTTGGTATTTTPIADLDLDELE
ncbi:hypothetical protein EDB85DRAFT_1898950 [Lactarius pseudohatsudake]|nr:hypothetical protein EDB85DRAFT_1898950 [Lactarius pseudohatsudake]